MEKEIYICRIFLQESNIKSGSEDIDFHENTDYNIDTRLSCNTEWGITSYDNKEAYNVSISFEITANVKDYTLYTLSFRQSGIFILKGYEEEEIDEILLIDCPHILMPYARLHTSNLTAQTGFSPAIIQEINFKEVYEHQKNES
tara:strand:+ start:120 stop:551 length:432 start_codon:yes stop_codon:yes gene_type:complete